MTVCPYCDKFQPTSRCAVAGCGGYVCPACGRCNRRETVLPEAHAAAQDSEAAATGGEFMPKAATVGAAGQRL